MKSIKTLVAVGALAFSANTFAASQGALTITGVVANNTYLSLTSMGQNDSSVDQTLNVDQIVTGAVTTKTFANIFHEVSNSTGGYKISLSSSQGGELRGPGTAKVKYSLDYSSAKVSITDCTLTAACEASSGGLTAKTSSAATVVVKATSTASEIAALPSGTYSDVVTVTIAAQ